MEHFSKATHRLQQGVSYFVVCALLGFGAPVLSVEKDDETDTDLESILTQPLEDSEYKEVDRCLRSADYRKVEIIDYGHLVFYGRRGDIWLNQLRHNCSGLRPKMTLQFEMHGRRLCSLDFFKGIERISSRMPTANCILGDFEKVTEEQIALLVDSLAKEKETDVIRRTNKAAKKERANNK